MTSVRDRLIGLLGTRPSYEMMADCDTILTVGSSFPYTQFMPDLGQARGVQIDVDGKQIGMRYPYEVNMVADAKSALTALLPLLSTRRTGSGGRRSSPMWPTGGRPPRTRP